MTASAALPKTRSDPRGVARRRRIFSALHDCVLAQGYVRTTLADIARAAGMRPSHLLYYFKGKEDILEQYFQLVSERFVERLAEFESGSHAGQISSLVDFWFRGETSTKGEIGFMLECFGAAVHDETLRQTKAEFDSYCKAHLARIFKSAPQPKRITHKRARENAELAYSMMIGLRSAVYFDDDIDLEGAHALFLKTVRQMCGYAS
ncbi:MAG: TetR/AcrR family transcriptional regulator [Pseudomonadota bacterium]